MKLKNNLLFTILLLLINVTVVFSQSKNITGKVTDENNTPLPGVSVIELGTQNGAVTDFNGDFFIKLTKTNSTLEFSYLGFKTVRSKVAEKTIINIKMVEDAEMLETILITAGIRGSQLRAVKAKREAATVIEAITPEDIGSFSDDNTADALQRVPGVQIERNVDGTSGDRVSIRGIGPQFVKITMNGRTPISAGTEGRSDMRQFNLNVIPTEVINGARIHKGTQAKEVSTAIGGSVDFQTLRPLDMKYKGGKNYFGIVNARGASNTEFEDIELNSRISAAFGGKINDKLGVFGAVMHADEKYFREESAFRNYRILDFKEDTNNDGTFDVANGDTLYEDILTPANVNNSLILENRDHLAIAAGIQWKPTSKLELMLDYSLTNLKNDSDRQFLQFQIGAGGNNGLLGTTNNNFFAPGSIGFNGKNLQYINASGANRSRVNIINRNVFFDNHTTNNIAGLNTKYKASDKLTINLDVSYSDLDFFQNLSNAGTNRLLWNGFDQNDISFDIRGDLPIYGLPDEITDPTSFTLLNTGVRHIKTKGYNYASKIDLEYKINKKTKLSLGVRSSTTDFETREAGNNSNRIPGAAYTADDVATFNASRTLTDGDFLYGKVGLNKWLRTPGAELLALKPAFAALDGGGVFDFDTPINEIVSETDNLVFASARSYAAKERTTAAYTQLDTKVKIFNIPVALNFGLRAVNTKNTSGGFTGVLQNDPIAGGNTIIDEALYHETVSSRWDVLPSFNANLKIKKNFNYRIGISKGVSRPRFKDMIPNNNVRMLDPNSEIFDPNSSEYIADLGSSTYRGTITSGNPDLKPYTAWMFDNTFELYSNNGGAFIFSAFYKNIKDYIGRSTLVDQQYPGEETLGVALPAGQENLLWDISKPINITNAKLYGFEVGFNQHFTFLPGFLSGFGLQANYAFVESEFDGAIGDATNGFPGSSKHNINSVLYFEKYGFTARFTAAKRSNYLSNLGGVGSTRADEAHYTEGNTVLGLNLQYKIIKKLMITAGVSNMTGEDTRRYIGDDPQNLNAYYNRNPVWKFGLRYKL